MGGRRGGCVGMSDGRGLLGQRLCWDHLFSCSLRFQALFCLQLIIHDFNLLFLNHAKGILAGIGGGGFRWTHREQEFFVRRF